MKIRQNIVSLTLIPAAMLGITLAPCYAMDQPDNEKLMGAAAVTHQEASQNSDGSTTDATTTSVPETKADISSPEDLLAIQPDDHVTGNPEAPHTVIEYASLSCSHCAHFYNDYFSEIRREYIDTGRVKFVYRDFPLNGPAVHAAMIAHCTGQERYFTFLKVFYKTQESWAFSSDYKDKLMQIAHLGGMKEEEFQQCLEDRELENRILMARQQASTLLGVGSTPTFFLDGQKIKGMLTADVLREKISE